jgi:nucleoside-diphosphate-sugar epimerase
LRRCRSDTISPLVIRSLDPDVCAPVSGVLVTGGSGFLGRAVVRELLRAGMSVRSFQRHPVPGHNVDAYTGDVRDSGAVEKAVLGVDAVIHTAGLAHVFRDARSAPFADVNERGTDVVARAAVAAGVRHFVHVSSVSVYGSPANGAHEEAVHAPAGAYAVSKAAAERRVIEAAAGSGMRVTILRLATLYGEGDRGNVQRLLQLIDRGRFAWVGVGTNRKSLIHVADAARACVQPVTFSGDPVETYNVSALPVSVREIVEELGRALNRPLPRWYIPTPVASAASTAALVLIPPVGRSLAKWLNDDVYPAGRFEQRFKFSTEVSLAEGMARQVAWWRARAGGSDRS